ncbi:MAG: alpha/beta hydrolase fold protein [Promethearchaeota archaeon CR_4]|nr:MAG: alpha/beta hydrolase fold protein [Candidatus Lokiarchaeota archaeon CR_4]
MSRKSLSSKAKKQFLVIVLFAGIFLAGIIVFHFVPVEVKRTYNQFTTTTDGVSICYDVFEPVNNLSTNKPAVILGHGIMVNKEIMRLIAIDLAKVGFVAVPFDFRGHGLSSGKLAFSYPIEASTTCEESPLEYDILAIKAYLNSRGDVDMKNLGYVGYSMGGGAGFALLSHDNDFNAMVGLAPLPSYSCTNLTNPRNLFLIVGQWDEAIDMDALWKVMENKTGQPKNALQLNTTYGNFASGTAARLYIDDNSDHFTAPYDETFVVEIRNWMLQALKGTTEFPASLSYYTLLAALFIQVIGGLAFFVTASVPILQKFSRKREVPSISQPLLTENSLKGLVGRYFIYILPLSFMFLPVGIPLAFTPLLFSGIFFALIEGLSVATLFFLWRRFKSVNISILQVYRKTITNTSRRNVGVGLGMGVLLYGILYLSFGNVLGIVPGLSRLVWLPLFYGVAFFAFVNMYLFALPVIQEKIGRARKWGVLYAILLNYTLVMASFTIVLVIICIFMGSFFLFLAFLPALILIFLINAVGGIYYADSNDVILPAIISAIFQTLVVCTLTPFVG